MTPEHDFQVGDLVEFKNEPGPIFKIVRFASKEEDYAFVSFWGAPTPTLDGWFGNRDEIGASVNKFMHPNSMIILAIASRDYLASLDQHKDRSVE